MFNRLRRLQRGPTDEDSDVEGDVVTGLSDGADAGGPEALPRVHRRVHRLGQRATAADQMDGMERRLGDITSSLLPLISPPCRIGLHETRRHFTEKEKKRGGRVGVWRQSASLPSPRGPKSSRQPQKR